MENRKFDEITGAFFVANSKDSVIKKKHGHFFFTIMCQNVNGYQKEGWRSERRRRRETRILECHAATF